MLGDTIAIMGEGQLLCKGSSMFLKKLYGAGYSLTIEKTEDCAQSALLGAVQSHIPTSLSLTVRARPLPAAAVLVHSLLV